MKLSTQERKGYHMDTLTASMNPPEMVDTMEATGDQGALSPP